MSAVIEEIQAAIAQAEEAEQVHLALSFISMVDAAWPKSGLLEGELVTQSNTAVRQAIKNLKIARILVRSSKDPDVRRADFMAALKLLEVLSLAPEVTTMSREIPLATGLASKLLSKLKEQIADLSPVERVRLLACEARLSSTLNPMRACEALTRLAKEVMRFDSGLAQKLLLQVGVIGAAYYFHMAGEIPPPAPASEGNGPPI